MVGRIEEVAVLLRIVESAVAGRTAIGVVEGEPGAGKTRLLEEAAAVAGGHQALAVWGSCLEGDGTPSMWPWEQALGTIVDSLPAPAPRLSPVVGPLAPPVRTAETLIRAGRRAAAKLAFESANRQLRHAVQVTRAPGLMDLELSALTLLAIVVRRQSGYDASTFDLLERAEYLARSLGRAAESADFLFIRLMGAYTSIEKGRERLARRMYEDGRASADPAAPCGPWRCRPPGSCQYRSSPPVIRLRSRLDVHTSSVTQTMVERLVTGDDQGYDRIVGNATALYRQRAGALADALEEHLPGVLDIRAPEGGLFLWPRLTDDTIDPDALFRRAAAHGVVYQPGEYFAADPRQGSAARHLRLAYSDRTPEELREAVRRLALAFPGPT